MRGDTTVASSNLAAVDKVLTFPAGMLPNERGQRESTQIRELALSRRSFAEEKRASTSDGALGRRASRRG